MLKLVNKLTSQADRKTGNLVIFRYRYISAVLISLCIAAILEIPVQAADKIQHISINCDVHNGVCEQVLDGTKVTLDISPKPVKAMTDLRFRLILAGKQPTSEPYIDLGMPGMKMGPNTVRLEKVAEGVYEGSGVIVRCPSGRKVWKAAINLPGLDTVEFVFDVVY